MSPRPVFSSMSSERKLNDGTEMLVKHSGLDGIIYEDESKLDQINQSPNLSKNNNQMSSILSKSTEKKAEVLVSK